MVAGCIRQVVVLYRNDCIGNWLGWTQSWSSYRVSRLRWFSDDTAHSGVHIYDFCGEASPHFYGNEQGF